MGYNNINNDDKMGGRMCASVPADGEYINIDGECTFELYV